MGSGVSKKFQYKIKISDLIIKRTPEERENEFYDDIKILVYEFFYVITNRITLCIRTDIKDLIDIFNFLFKEGNLNVDFSIMKLKSLNGNYIPVPDPYPQGILSSRIKLTNFGKIIIDHNNNLSTGIFIFTVYHLREKILEYINDINIDDMTNEYIKICLIDFESDEIREIYSSYYLWSKNFLDSKKNNYINQDNNPLVIKKYLELEVIRKNKIILENKIKFHSIKMANCNYFLQATSYLIKNHY